VAPTGAGTAPTVTTPANTTVIRRTATETGTMLYARMGLPRYHVPLRKTRQRGIKRLRSNDIAKTTQRCRNGKKMAMNARSGVGLIALLVSTALATAA
jgi:hypothetical protein